MVDVYADEGITGTFARKRDDFQRMLADCRKGKIDKILVKSISRFARNTTECLETIRELKALGISIFFEEHNIDTKMVASEMLTAVLASCAQAESESISKNMRWSYQKRMESGEFITCKAPFGYRLIDRQLIIEETEAEIIRMVFQWFLSGWNTVEIAEELTKRGIKTREGLDEWKSFTIKRIIENEKYIGDALLQKKYSTDTFPPIKKCNRGEMPQYYVENSHPPIIDRDVFAEAQKLLKSKRPNLIGKPKHQHFLKQKIICRNCGTPFRRFVGKGIPYWVCNNHNHGGECGIQPIREADVHSAFLRLYLLYSEEMKNKLDEICRKYDLDLLGPMLVDTTADNMFRELGISGVLREGAKAEVEWYRSGPGYFFRNGTFDVEFAVTLTGEDNPWPFENHVFFRCHNKSSFDAVYFSMLDPSQFEEWSYTTSDGVDVLLVMGPEGALIVADNGDYFITVGGFDTKISNILDGEHTMSREGLEAYAEVFNFSICPQRLTEEQIAAVKGRYDAQCAADEAEQEKKNEEFQEYLGRASYDARVKFHLENDGEATRMGYTFYDFDGNGVEELVIGRDGYIEYIYTEKNGETAEILGWPKMGNTYLATDGTLVIMSDNTYWFVYVENGERIMDYWVERRTYWGHSDESPWRLCYGVDDDRPITEEEYYEYRNSKERVVLDMLPLTEYPLPEPANYNTDGKDISIYTRAETYEDLIRMYLTNPVELQPGVYLEPRYVLLDLDGDGQEELIVDEETYRAVYTMRDGKLMPMYSGEIYDGEGLNICRGNMIEIVHPYSGDNKVYCYYRMSGTTGEMVEYLRYDEERNPQNPWFRSTDATGQDHSLEPISKVEFDRIRQSYAPLELEWKPITEYPLE